MKRPSGPRPLDTQRTPTPTHRFPMRPGITWTSRSPSFGSPFGRPNPKYPPPDHPDGAGSKPIGRKPITGTEVLFSPFFCVRFVPPTYLTHTCIRFLFTSATQLPRTHDRTLVFASFRIHGATEFRAPHLNYPDLLSFVSSILLECDNPESEPQEPGHRRQKPGPA